MFLVFGTVHFLCAWMAQEESQHWCGLFCHPYNIGVRCMVNPRDLARDEEAATFQKGTDKNAHTTPTSENSHMTSAFMVT